MCHLLLLLPVVALAVFWLLPLSVAFPVYALAVGEIALVDGLQLKARKGAALEAS